MVRIKDKDALLAFFDDDAPGAMPAAAADPAGPVTASMADAAPATVSVRSLKPSPARPPAVRAAASVPLGNAIGQIQKHMAEKHAELTADHGQDELFRSYIENHITDKQIKVPGHTRKQLADRVYSEMREESILTPYLRDPSVEEININAWYDVKIVYSNGTTAHAADHFLSAVHASDVLARMLQKSNITIDESQPIVRGYLGTNVRITAMGFGTVDRDKGIAASIRMVNPQKLALGDFIRLGTATAEMLDFLVQAFKYNASMCLAGPTSSGKTTLMELLMAGIDDNMRLFTIEGGVREFNCERFGPAGLVENSVVHAQTKETLAGDQTIDQNRLLETALTFNPDFISVAEMKGGESFEAISAANTGHTVITTIHANSCADIYKRMVVLCKRNAGMDDGTLFDLATSAFPITLYCKKLVDKSRRIMEICECTGADGKKPVMRTLYRYNIHENVPDGHGNITIAGGFEKVSGPSPAFLARLRENGMPDNVYARLFATATTTGGETWT